VGDLGFDRSDFQVYRHGERLQCDAKRRIGCDVAVAARTQSIACARNASSANDLVGFAG
jgi:hypothetical protein